VSLRRRCLSTNAYTVPTLKTFRRIVMAKMGKYCKAYPISRLREFKGWSENVGNARKEKKQVDGKEIEVERELTDDVFLYLQENFFVTDDIFIDENIIFDNVTPDWIDFCTNVLSFEVPTYEPIKVSAPETENDNYSPQSPQG
jgi:hypothetical protein